MIMRCASAPLPPEPGDASLFKTLYYLVRVDTPLALPL